MVVGAHYLFSMPNVSEAGLGRSLGASFDGLGNSCNATRELATVFIDLCANILLASCYHGQAKLFFRGALPLLLHYARIQD